MFDFEPDYSTYSMEELLQCLKDVDQARWPERYANIQKWIEAVRRTSEGKQAYEAKVFTDYCLTLCESRWDDPETVLLSPATMLMSPQQKVESCDFFSNASCPICNGALNFEEERHECWTISCPSCDCSVYCRYLRRRKGLSLDF
ncbi:hypothetical protein [Corallincola platygyrae]|uniref:hypothetical protein n=1 Tax=Corallincola platygyrae TaxID=1193278 RepID=UPI0031F02FEB